MTPVLAIDGLWKSYATPVLLDVQLELLPGEVHALVGENGAGKSTLARIVTGLTAPERGQMRLKGTPYAPRTKREAAAHGVHLVLQELNVIGTLTVAENIFFDQLPHRAGWIDRRRLDRAARPLMQSIGLGHLEPQCPVGSLGIGQQQLVEIAASLWRRCDLLILDEPTAALTDTETALLFTQIRRLREGGAAVLYISHRLEELQQIADRITILRDGRVVGTHPVGQIRLDRIVSLMVGRDLGDGIHWTPRVPGPVAMSVRGLCRGDRVRGVSFDARRGEILGFAGLMGAGRTETMRAIFGADRADSGTIALGNDVRPASIASPRDAVRQGIAFLTEDRKSQGLLLPLPVRSNVTLTALGRLCRRFGWIRRLEESTEADRWQNRLGIRCRSTEQRVQELSGGNQQKVVLAKWLFRDCEVLIFDEPTRGIDVGAKFDIYRLLLELAERGKAVLVISSDLKELMALCDRILVMSAGKITGEFVRGQWSQEKIMAAALREHLERGKQAAMEGK